MAKLAYLSVGAFSSSISLREIGIDATEDQANAQRADVLRKIKAAVRFVSAEPLLGPLSINWRGIHWCIIGGESGVHLYDQKVREQRALVDYALRVHNSPPRLRKANLLPVRTKEEIISRVRHQLSLAHRARARGNSSSGGI